MKRFLLCLLTAVPLLSIAQSNFHKGYVVTNSQDTLRGFIDYKERNNNPSFIIFKTSPDSKVQTLALKDYTSYSIDNLVRYQRFAVNISMDNVDLSKLSIGIDSASKRDTVFLEVLQEGKNLSMFSYQDAIKPRFYVQCKTDTEPQELIRQDYLNENNTAKVVSLTKYKRQLARLLFEFKMNSAANERRVNSLAYKRTDMIKLAAVINEQEIARSAYKSMRFFAGTGIIISKAVYSGDYDLAGPGVLNKAYTFPVLTAGMDFFANPAIGKLIYRIEFSLSKAKYEITRNYSVGSYEYFSHSFDRTEVRISPQAIYNIYNGAKFKAFVGAGLNFYIAGYSNVIKQIKVKGNQNPIIDDSNPRLDGINLSFPFTAGVVLNKKIQFSAGYAVPYTIKNTPYYSLNISSYKFGVNYLFGSH